MYSKMHLCIYIQQTYLGTVPSYEMPIIIDVGLLPSQP